ncbi:ParB/RepB/Spo0J family partition protein [Prevotella sp. PINT]|jgi:ParB-like partition proteins|uniref:ParB/RepB/Spo0J family partition protein n=1 Tax=Palleniella intestinalis TaxID=2736291 RepID=UPI00155629DD|nr:ParB/RepB/Spo0J family partition protein [Palleniella intestinalis]NPD80745.1 ParB/RepB/Spo0J family partition protein [Palleniella intestinalis]
MAVRKKFTTLGRGLDDISAPGKGLGALISTNDVQTSGSSMINEIPITQIERNPDQPRRDFDQEALMELATSIREIGIVQPITLRQLSENHYQIIAGERRWRASQLAGLSSLPAYIRTINDENVMEMALVENIQREDLNAIEIALGYQHLIDNTGMTQERLAERVGKKRTTVANFLRLLKLPAQVQMALQKKEIDMGHARALLSLDDPKMQIKLFKDIIKSNLSVRKVEELVQQLKNGETVELGKKKVKGTPALPEPLEAVRRHLAERIGQKVQLSCGNNGKGKITIPFANEEELLRILDTLN